jgi:hypothetical protein
MRTRDLSGILSHVATSLLRAFPDMEQLTPIWLIKDAATLLRIGLRNAVVMWRAFITPDNCWHKTTWPEF